MLSDSPTHSRSACEAQGLFMKFSLVLSFAVAVAAAHSQSYIAYDLGPNANGYAISNGTVGGSVGAGIASRATIWGYGSNPLDVHPAFLNGGWSSILGISGATCVGTGNGPGSNNRIVPIVWQNGTAEPLPVPYAIMAGRANATDGAQIVGSVNPLELVRDVPSFGASHAVVWTQNGGFIDLSPGGNPTYCYGVASGQQVGAEQKGSEFEARLWFGSSRGYVNLHPRNFDTSQALATDGIRQVGSVGLDVQVFVEKRGRRVRFNYAAAWNGSATNFTTLGTFHFGSSFALAVRGDTICGREVATSNIGSIQFQHAIAWVGAQNFAVDLHSLLPVGSTYSNAASVDDVGNICGSAILADGQTHAIIWVRQ